MKLLLTMLLFLTGVPVKRGVENQSDTSPLQPLYQVTNLQTDCEAGNNDEFYPAPFGFGYFKSIQYNTQSLPVEMMAALFPQSSKDWPFLLKLSYDNNNRLSSIKVYVMADNPTYEFTRTYTMSYKATLTGKAVSIYVKEEKNTGTLPTLFRTLVYNKQGQLVRQYRPDTFHNDYTYQYNSSGNVTRIYENAGANKPKELRWEYLSYDTRFNPANFSSNVLAFITGIYSKQNPTKYIYHYTASPTDLLIERSLNYTYEKGIPVKFDVKGYDVQLTSQEKIPLDKKGVFYCSFIVK